MSILSSAIRNAIYIFDTSAVYLVRGGTSSCRIADIESMSAMIN